MLVRARSSRLILNRLASTRAIHVIPKKIVKGPQEKSAESLADENEKKESESCVKAETKLVPQDIWKQRTSNFLNSYFAASKKTLTSIPTILSFHAGKLSLYERQDGNYVLVDQQLMYTQRYDILKNIAHIPVSLSMLEDVDISERRNEVEKLQQEISAMAKHLDMEEADKDRASQLKIIAAADDFLSWALKTLTTTSESLPALELKSESALESDEAESDSESEYAYVSEPDPELESSALQEMSDSDLESDSRLDSGLKSEWQERLEKCIAEMQDPVEYNCLRAAEVQLHLLDETVRAWDQKHHINWMNTRTIAVAAYAAEDQLIEKNYFINWYRARGFKNPEKDKVYSLAVLPAWMSRINEKELINDLVAVSERVKPLGKIFKGGNEKTLFSDVLSRQSSIVFQKLFGDATQETAQSSKCPFKAAQAKLSMVMTRR